MTTITDLKTAIFQAANAFANIHSLPISFPGISFTKPTSGEWLELSVIPNDFDYGINESRKFRRGIVQINVCGIKDKSGDLALQAIADLAETIYPMGTVILDAVRITTNPTTEAAIVRNNTDYIIPVSFEYSE